ncbi:MAG: hypothetical protein AAF467_10015 [Actinomycetota bacterium]
MATLGTTTLRAPRRWRVAALASASVLLFAACAGGTSGSTNAEGDGVSAEGGFTSPIAEFLGEETFDFSDPEAAEARYLEEERARQDVIAQCMADQGFEYVPFVPDTGFGFIASDGLEYGSEEWVAKYGFGITTTWFSQEEVGPNLIGNDYGNFEEAFANDPNQEIRSGMSDAEAEAYDGALYGDQSFFEVDETLSEEEAEAQFDDFEPNFEEMGCQGQAYNESDGNTAAFYQEFNDDLDVMYERMEADPRVQEVEREVAECVTGKGLEYTDIDEVNERLFEEVSALESQVGFPGENLTDEDFENMSPDEIEAIYNQPRELPEEVLTKLGELQAEEIELAQAVEECGGGFDAQQDLAFEILAEYEQEFLDDNADRLAEFQAEG